MTDIAEFLNAQMQRGQGYKLLQGFPPPKMMQEYVDDFYGKTKQEIMRTLSYEGDLNDPLVFDVSKKLIIGVLPSPCCNSAVEGCGFCTFPHEKYDTQKGRNEVNAVLNEINTSSRNYYTERRTVDSVYFGGGTANIIPVNKFLELVSALGNFFDISNAELSLEGVPVYFSGDKGNAYLDALADLQVGTRRISMGVQTFDADWLEKMGRTHFGDEAKIRAVVEQAHNHEIAVSGDFLINLPGQGLEAMIRDMDIALEMGFDQICVYNLVMFPGIGSVWSRDNEMCSKAHPTEKVYAHWKEVRAKLLNAGLEQTTLTNFERNNPADGRRRRFNYEVQSYHPQIYEGLGFGKSGISILTSKDLGIGCKIINGNDDYSPIGRNPRFKAFVFNADSLRVAYMVRNLSRGYIHFADFSENLPSHFQEEFNLLESRGLVTITPEELRLTEKGMFFADAICALIARKEAEKAVAQKTKPIAVPPDFSLFDIGSNM